MILMVFWIFFIFPWHGESFLFNECNEYERILVDEGERVRERVRARVRGPRKGKAFY